METMSGQEQEDKGIVLFVGNLPKQARTGASAGGGTEVLRLGAPAGGRQSTGVWRPAAKGCNGGPSGAA